MTYILRTGYGTQKLIGQHMQSDTPDRKGGLEVLIYNEAGNASMIFQMSVVRNVRHLCKSDAFNAWTMAASAFIIMPMVVVRALTGQEQHLIIV